MPDKPTWNELVAAEPRLADLLRDCRAVSADDPRFCANAVWYGYTKEDRLADNSDGWGYGLRGRVSRLVGWSCKGNPVLGTEAAYRVAYRTCYDALPPCRECICM